MAAHRLRRGGLAAITFVLSIGLALPACGSDDSNSLFGAWTLTSASNAGAPVDVPGDIEIRWQFQKEGGCGDRALSCPDGPKLVGNDVCNDFVSSIQVDAGRVLWRDGGETTAVGCAGPLTDTLRDFFQGDSIGYSVADDQLRLTSSDGLIEVVLRSSHDK